MIIRIKRESFLQRNLKFLTTWERRTRLQNVGKCEMVCQSLRDPGLLGQCLLRLPNVEMLPIYDLDAIESLML